MCVLFLSNEPEPLQDAVCYCYELLLCLLSCGLKYQKFVLDYHGWLLIHLDLPIHLCHFAENIRNDKDILIKGFRYHERQLNSKSVRT